MGDMLRQALRRREARPPPQGATHSPFLYPLYWLTTTGEGAATCEEVSNQWPTLRETIVMLQQWACRHGVLDVATATHWMQRHQGQHAIEPWGYPESDAQEAWLRLAGAEQALAMA
eukprot:3667067-Prorocentrum_lima.AAC.1